MLRHRAQLLALVEVLPGPINNAIVELHPRHDLGVDGLGLHFFLRREGFAERVRPRPDEQKLLHKSRILRRVEAFGRERFQ